MESILTSIKKLLGIAEEYTHFDDDIVMHINTVFVILTQLGVGPSNGFSIKDASTPWDEFIDDDELLEVTPKSLRIRKKILDKTLRLRSKVNK